MQLQFDPAQPLIDLVESQVDLLESMVEPVQPLVDSIEPLLNAFESPVDTSSETMLWQTVIHLTFVASAVALALIDRYLSPKSAPDHLVESNGHQGPDSSTPAPAKATG